MNKGTVIVFDHMVKDDQQYCLITAEPDQISIFKVQSEDVDAFREWRESVDPDIQWHHGWDHPTDAFTYEHAVQWFMEQGCENMDMSVEEMKAFMIALIIDLASRPGQPFAAMG